MLALPPASGLYAEIIFGHLRYWQDEGGTKWISHSNKDGKPIRWEPIPTKEQVDAMILCEKEMIDRFWGIGDGIPEVVKV